MCIVYVQMTFTDINYLQQEEFKMNERYTNVLHSEQSERIEVYHLEYYVEYSSK